MPDQPAYTVQRFRGGFALVWHEQGRRRRKQLQATDRQSAEAEAQSEWQGADDRARTVGWIMTAYIESIAGKPAHSRSIDAWKAMAPFWETVDPARVTEAMCKSYRGLRNVADATARYELMRLSTAMSWAVKKGYISARGITWLPPKTPRRERHLTREQFARFHAAMVAPHARLYAMIGLYTLARPTAILELRWGQIDFMRRQIDLNPPGRAQTAKRRPVVPIGDALLAELQSAFAARTSVYVIERAGKPVRSVRKAFLAASQRSGVHASPYTLRHTGTVWAAEAGRPMSELAQMLGHDDSRTTETFYARYSPGYLKSVADAIEYGRISA